MFDLENKKRSRPFWHPFYVKPSLVWSYIKIAFRKIKRHKAYSFINLAGLTVGMASCILILLWVWNELSFSLILSFQQVLVLPLKKIIHRSSRRFVLDVPAEELFGSEIIAFTRMALPSLILSFSKYLHFPSFKAMWIQYFRLLLPLF